MTRQNQPQDDGLSAVLEPIERLIDKGTTFLSVKEVADMLGLSAWQVYQFCSAGVLSSTKQGRVRSIPPAAVREYVIDRWNERDAS